MNHWVQVMCGTTLLLAAGCGRQDPFFSERVYSGDLCEGDITGRWVIAEESLHALIDSGACVVYTNQTDHMFSLEPNGVCEFSGLSSYSTRRLWRFSSEEERHMTASTRWKLRDARKEGSNFVDLPFEDEKYRYRIDILFGAMRPGDPRFVGIAEGQLQMWCKLHESEDGTSTYSCMPIRFKRTAASERGAHRSGGASPH